MQTKRMLITVAVLMGVLTWTAEWGHCSQDLGPYGVWLNTVGAITGPGPATLEFGIVRISFPDSLIITVQKVGKLQYFGPERLSISPDGRDTVRCHLDVEIPPNDTSGIIVELYVRGGNYNGSSRYFVTTGDTLEIYHSWPQPPQPKELQTTFYEMGGGMHRVPGSEIPPWKRPPQKPVIKIMTPDSAGWRDPRVDPKTADSTNGIDEGGGKLPSYSGPKVVDSAGWSTLDGLREAAQKDMETESNKKRELIVDLRKPEDYNYMQTLATELIPCDTTGYFRVKLTRAQAKEVHDRGISITSSRPAPGPHPAPKEKQ